MRLQVSKMESLPQRKVNCDPLLFLGSYILENSYDMGQTGDLGVDTAAGSFKN